MPKRTIQERLCAGMIALGYIEIEPTTRYRRFSKDGANAPHWFVGTAGALRVSRSGLVAETVMCSVYFRRDVLAAGE